MFEYYGGESVVHQMNPLIKLACTAPLILAATLSLVAVPSLIFVTISFIIAFGLARLPVGKFFKTLAPFLILGVGFLWFYSVAASRPADPALFHWGPIRVTAASLDMGIALFLRVTTIMSLTVVFMMTTTPVDFVLSLIHQAKLDQRIAFGMFAAIRFMPIVQGEMVKISQAHRIRGVGERAGVLGSVKRLKRYAIPLLSSVIRMAIRTALAMDLKAFGVYEDRTYLRKTTVSRQDIMIVVGFTLFIIALSVWLVQSGIWADFRLSNLQGQPGR